MDRPIQLDAPAPRRPLITPEEKAEFFTRAGELNARISRVLEVLG
ncbi:hypothetical protein ABT218_29250 [Streptomyces sp. NPDC001455]